MSKELKISTTFIENRIFSIRNMQIMIDRDLAEMYQVETRVLNQAVKRNLERFPGSFRFQLNNKENDELAANCDRFNNLKSQSVTSSSTHGGRRKLPYAFTEQGVAMKNNSQLPKGDGLNLPKSWEIIVNY